VAPAFSAGPAQGLHLRAGPSRSPYPSTTRTPTPRSATLRTPTPFPSSTRSPHTNSTSGRTKRIPSPRTTPLSIPCQGRPLGKTTRRCTPSRNANNVPNHTRAELPAQPNRTRSNAGGPPQGGTSNREVVPHRAPAGGGSHDPDGGGSDSGSSNHGANRRAGGGGSRGGRGHANSHASGASQGGYDARQKIEELRRKKSTTAGDNDGFPAFSPRVRNLLLPDKFKPLVITKYDAKQDPI
jgi:hypothetical protein